MIREGRNCEDILIQISAVRSGQIGSFLCCL